MVVNNIHHSTSNSGLKIIKPVFIRRPSLPPLDADEVDYQAVRRDSGISLDEDFEKLGEQKLISSPTLPVLSPIDATLPPPTETNNSKPKYTINLPRLSSIIADQSYQYQQKLQAPILSPPPLFLLDRSCAVTTPSPSNSRSTGYKGASSQSQFICRHVIDQTIGKLCYQTFRRSYDLSRHQTIHLKNRPLCYCQQCNKKFTRLDALRRHERIQGHGSK